MTIQEFSLNVCFNIKARICNDSIGYVKEADTKRIVAKWATEELGLPPGCELDITMGYGEVEVFDIEPVTVEIM